jgi:hypothetical protein
VTLHPRTQDGLQQRSAEGDPSGAAVVRQPVVTQLVEQHVAAGVHGYSAPGYQLVRQAGEQRVQGRQPGGQQRMHMRRLWDPAPVLRPVWQSVPLDHGHVGKPAGEHLRGRQAGHATPDDNRVLSHDVPPAWLVASIEVSQCGRPCQDRLRPSTGKPARVERARKAKRRSSYGT